MLYSIPDYDNSSRCNIYSHYIYNLSIYSHYKPIYTCRYAAPETAVQTCVVDLNQTFLNTFNNLVFFIIDYDQ